MKKDTKRVFERLRVINRDAKIMLTQRSRVDLDEILDLRAFDRKRIASQIKAYEVDTKTDDEKEEGHLLLTIMMRSRSRSSSS